MPVAEGWWAGAERASCHVVLVVLVLIKGVRRSDGSKISFF